MCLVGLRGAGKTTVGQALAQRLGRPFVDLDRAVESRSGASIRELFAEWGEDFFRNLEGEVLGETLRLVPGAVVATGGGVVLREANRERLREALVVYLDASPAALAGRVSEDARSADQRPPLAGGGPLGEARTLRRERDELYRQVADLVVDAEGGVEQVVDALVSALATSG